MIYKFIDEKINKLRKRRNKTICSSLQSHSPITSVHQLQSPNHQLRPYYTSSPKHPPTPILLQYPLTMPRQIQSEIHTSPSLFPSVLTFSETSISSTTTPSSHIITKNEIEDYLDDRFKKSTTEYSPRNYINDIVEDDIELSNNVIMEIITDYNKYTNNITNPDYFISRANLILKEYINVNDFKSDNIYQAYNFIILGNVVSFWILYKFLIDDTSINTHYLGYHLSLNNVSSNTDLICNIELDILESINYCVLKFV